MSGVACTSVPLSPGAVSSAASLGKEAPGAEAGEEAGEAAVGGRPGRPPAHKPYSWGEAVRCPALSLWGRLGVSPHPVMSVSVL